MRPFSRPAHWCALALALLMTLVAGCNKASNELTVDEAVAKIRTGLAARPLTWSFQEHMSRDEYAKNPTLRAQLEKMHNKGLLDVVAAADGSAWHVKLTPQGEKYRLTKDVGRPILKGEVVVRTAARTLDRVDAIGKLRTNSGGATSRDVTYTWHYSEVTPFGEVLGVKSGEPQQASVPAVLFGDGWRFSIE